MAVNPFGFSTTPLSNTAIGGVDVQENSMTVAAVNNAIRAGMAGQKEILDLLCGGKTTGGAANAYTLTSGLSLSALAAGMSFTVKANHTNTGAATLDVDGIGAKDIKDQAGGALAAGAITSGGPYTLVYVASADDFYLTTPYLPAVTAASTFTDNYVIRADGASRGVQTSAWIISDAGVLSPTSDDGGALGSTSLQVSDICLASGGVINWNNGDVLATHSSNTLAFTGASTGYTFDGPLSATTITGTGALSIGTSNSATVGTIELGAASDTTLSRDSAGVLAVEGVPVFSNIPQQSKSANYTTVLGDAQKHILHPSTDNNPRTFTIDSNANVAYPTGTAITFINMVNTVTIAITSDTMTLMGTGGTGSRTLAANGIATAIKIGSTSWVISGTGLT